MIKLKDKFFLTHRHVLDKGKVALKKIYKTLLVAINLLAIYAKVLKPIMKILLHLFFVIAYTYQEMKLEILLWL